MVEWFVKFRAGSCIEPEIIPVTIADTEALLNFLYQQIGCSSVETVRFGRSGTSVLVVDEEGLLKRILFRISSVVRCIPVTWSET